MANYRAVAQAVDQVLLRRCGSLRALRYNRTVRTLPGPRGPTHLSPRLALSWALTGALLCGLAQAQSPAASSPTRLRGVVESFDGNTLVLNERGGGRVALQLAEGFSVTEVVPFDVSTVQAGTYVGAAAMPQADGSAQAVAVAVYPDALYGVGAGHMPWDLQAGSTMTNATVTEVMVAKDGRTLALRWQGGDLTLLVPDGTPIVGYRAGNPRLLVPGGKVVVSAEWHDGKATALRAQAGRNGFAPPL